MTQSARLLLLAAGAAFLALLDVTVVNLAIPALSRAYPHTSVSSLSWVITAYATMFAALLAPAGRLADVIGRRALFRAGVGGFALMSAACAAAPSVPVLLAARALQGAAAAAMIPASLAIVLTDTPAERRMASIGVWSAAGAFAAAVGTLITNRDRQPNVCTSTPPTLGPTAAAKAPAALHTPIEAILRSTGVSVSTIASEAGIIAAAAAP